MKLLRQLYRITASAAVFILAVLLVPCCTLQYRGWQKVIHAANWTRLWAKTTARILNMKILLHGNPEDVSGKLVISNHTGTLDIIAEGAIFPLRFAPKAEMRKWPVFGTLVSCSCPVWIDRSNKIKSAETANEIAGTLEHGLSMLVYPEGTSTDGRNGLLPFKSTAFESALRSGAPILPVLVFHRGVPEHEENLSWHGDHSFLNHILTILGLKEIHSSVYIMPEVHPLPGEDRKELADRMHRLMEEEYRKISTGSLTGNT